LDDNIFLIAEKYEARNAPEPKPAKLECECGIFTFASVAQQRMVQVSTCPWQVRFETNNIE
jgi:hypothetical protein